MMSNSKISVDYIIVGQGIAGTLMHFALKKRGEKVLIIDNHHKGSATKVAAGGINPITGKRYVKSWRFEELISAAKKTYRELEQLLDIEIFKDRNIFRILKNAGEENTWLGRSGDPLYADYFVENPSVNEFEEHLNSFPSIGEIRNGAQVNISHLVEKYRTHLLINEELISESFDYEKLEINPKIKYKNIEATNLLFCEGAASSNNPFFNYLPFELSKGEALTIKISNSKLEKILRHKVSIVPTTPENYWVGASNDWEFSDDTPTQKGKEELEGYLKQILKSTYQIVDHKAAIRPTVKDRRPLLGKHPSHDNLFIFNGLGTKGASLGPALSEIMSDFLLNKKTLWEEIDIKRYEKLYLPQ